MFKEYNPMQYLAIDVANQFGLDKLNFENRIDWVKTNIDYLEEYQTKAEEPILYYKAVKALRQAMSGKPINHAVALDAVCSGLSLMSVMMNCRQGCYLTGLIDPDNRIDAYTEITTALNKKLDSDMLIPRKDSKRALMTMLYGSKAVPEEVFGADVNTFYKTVAEECTGAYKLLQLLLDSWDSYALNHSWYMPDRHYVYCPVMQTNEKRVTLTDWEYSPVVNIKENIGLKQGVSNAANVIHSIDGYVLRTLIRRCNYKPKKVKQALSALVSSTDDYKPNELNTYWFKTKMPDITYLDEIISKANELDRELKDELIRILTMVLKHKPFDVICIHDSFAVHPNHCNQLRFHYKEILAELADSTVIDDILNQLYGNEDTVAKGESVSSYIRNSNYGLC